MKRLLICFLLSSFILPVMPQEDCVDPWIKKGTELRDLGCYESAVRYYQNGLSIYPESMLIYFEMAYSYACMNQMEKSFECAEKAMYADDRSEELLYLWMFIIAAYENTEPENENKEELDYEYPAVDSGQTEQIY